MAPRWFHTTYEQERRGLLRADIVLAINSTDAHVLERMVPEKTVLVAPHGESVRPAPPGKLVCVNRDRASRS